MDPRAGDHDRRTGAVDVQGPDADIAQRLNALAVRYDDAIESMARLLPADDPVRLSFEWIVDRLRAGEDLTDDDYAALRDLTLDERVVDQVREVQAERRMLEVTVRRLNEDGYPADPDPAR